MSELGYLRPVDRTASPGKVRYAVDVVAKVENRTTDKVSRKLVLGLRCCRVGFPRAKRISGSKNFRSSPQKDFCNTIPPEAEVSYSAATQTGGDEREGGRNGMRKESSSARGYCFPRHAV